MITSAIPRDWKALQDQVGQILSECGLDVTVEKHVVTVRGTVEIDVYARDSCHRPVLIYLCECKYWKTAVPQTIIHAFRTVVTDCGAHCGLIISSAGFQKGAFKAAENSNIALVTWADFQQMFSDRWIHNYLVPHLRPEVEPLVDYTEPMNIRIFNKADFLSSEHQQRFRELREEYGDTAFFALSLYLHPESVSVGRPALPLRAVNLPTFTRLPPDVVTATAYRELMEALIRHAREGLSRFDELFGERA